MGVGDEGRREGRKKGGEVERREGMSQEWSRREIGRSAGGEKKRGLGRDGKVGQKGGGDWYI